VKFKTLFILFNLVIVISFLIIYFMPLFMLGWEYTSVFWAKNWFLPVIFIAVIGGLNFYFIRNWKLFRYLESESWDKLKDFLEGQIFEKNQFRTQYIRVLVNTYLVRSEVENIGRLEQYLAEKTPRVRKKFALLLGIPYILSNDSMKMKEYFKEFLTEAKGKEGAWIKWCYAFACFTGEDKENAKYLLLELSEQQQDPILRLLTIYLLEAFRNDDPDIGPLVDRQVSEIKTAYTASAWEQEIEKGKKEIFLVILSKLINDATEWLLRKEITPQNPER
jgi:hypothetical protein